MNELLAKHIAMIYMLMKVEDCGVGSEVYGCGSLRLSSILDASHVSDIYGGSSSASQSQRSSGASLLCRCGSGGALLPAQYQQQQARTEVMGCSRGAQSLPSTPNSFRRPVSPSFTTYCLNSTNVGVIGSYGDDPCYAVYGTTAPSTIGSDCNTGAMSESTMLASNMANEDRNTPFRALHHWTQQTHLRYRTTSQPLMKLSTLVIVLLAFLIIGFIVLSPLFHYLMS